MNLTHHFLIAMPQLQDSHFQRTVTYICEHNNEGAMGIVLSKFSDISLEDLFQELSIADVRPEKSTLPNVLNGGPVAPEAGFVLHRPLGQWESTFHVTDTIGLTSSLDILHAIANNQYNNEYLIALGYAGWGAMQLEYEISQNAWLTYPADGDIIFNTTPQALWDTIANSMGVNLDLLSNQHGHA